MEQYEREEREAKAVQEEAHFTGWCSGFKRSKSKRTNIWRDTYEDGAKVRVTAFYNRDRSWWGWCIAGVGGTVRYSPTQFRDCESALRDLWEVLGRPE